MVFETWLKSDLQKPVEVERLTGNLFSADRNGNRIGVEVYDGGTAAVINGVVRGYIIREDGKTVTVTGNVDGNKAWITLPDAVYRVIGPVSIVIKIGSITIGACTGYVYQTTTDKLVDPSGEVPSLADLMDAVARATAAAAQAEGAVNTANSAMSTATQAANTASTMNAVFARNLAAMEDEIDTNNASVTNRLNTQDSTITSRLAEQDSTITSRLAEQDTTIDNFIDEYESFENGLTEKATAAADIAEAARVLVDNLASNISAAGIPLRVINRPNLIKQNYWTTRDVPTSPTIAQTYTVPVEDATAAASALTYTITDSAITSSYDLFFAASSDQTALPNSSISATFAAGTATIKVAARTGAHTGTITVNVVICTYSNMTVPYGNAYKVSGPSYPYLKSISTVSGWDGIGEDSTDGINCSVVTLTGNNIITDDDGEVYDHALQFNITAPASGYNNCEWLMYCNPNGTVSTTKGASALHNYGQLEFMQPGKRYTLSFWARMLSGDNRALARFGFGTSYTNTPYTNTQDGTQGISDFVEITGTSWARYSWTFEFNPTGDWYTDTVTTTTQDGDTVTTTTRTYNWYKKVLFGIARRYDGVVQLCGFRMTDGSLWQTTEYDKLYEKVMAQEDAMEIVAEASDIIDSIPATKANLLANLAGAEKNKATSNHAVGDLITVGETLYKVTAAITSGETVTVGTNVAAVTVADLLAEKAPIRNPTFTGYVAASKFKSPDAISHTSLAIDEYGDGNRSIAMGKEPIINGDYAVSAGEYTDAQGNASQALGYHTTSTHRSQHVFGEYNAIDTATTAYSARGNFIEIVGNGTGEDEEETSVDWQGNETTTIVKRRKNARTLDWAGNETLAGGLTLGMGTTNETTISAAQLKSLLALLP